MCTMYIYKLWGLPANHRLHPRIIVYYYFLNLQGMQILFVPERHHWVLSSCVKGNVALYDSASASYRTDSLQIQLSYTTQQYPPKPTGYWWSAHLFTSRKGNTIVAYSLWLLLTTLLSAMMSKQWH